MSPRGDSRAASVSSISTLSVISRVSASGSSELTARVLVSVSSRSALSWRADRLTDMVSGIRGKASLQWRSCRHASPSTHAPMGTIKPVSSAKAMNSPGGTTTCWSVRQRIRASAPATQPNPPKRSVCGAPIRSAAAPASRLPKGAVPMKAIV